MAIVEVRESIRAKQADAFNTALDYRRRKDWDPFAGKFGGYVFSADKRFADITAWNGMRMRVEHITWLPPERAAMRMVQGPFMLASFAGSWAFRQVGDIVDARFRYQIKAKPLWRWLEPVMRRYFRWEAQRRLRALKNYLEASSHD